MDQIECVEFNYKVYRLKDLQKIIDVSKANSTILNIIPYKINYIIRSHIINDKRIYDIYTMCDPYQPYNNLAVHLELLLNDSQSKYCSVHLYQKDIDIIDTWLKSNN